MAKQSVQIKVDGLRELQRDIRRAKDKELGKELRRANKDAADVGAQASKPKAPHQSGRLAKSISGRADQKGAYVKAGGARTPYAPPIHWGWPRRNIIPQKFIYAGVLSNYDKITKAYEEAMKRLGNLLSSKRG